MKGFKDLAQLKKLWPYLKQDRYAFYGLCLLVPCISVLELSQPLLLKHAIDDGIIAHEKVHSLTYYTLSFGALVFFGYLCRTAQSVLTTSLVQRLIRRLRRRLSMHVLQLSASFHDQNLSGALTTRLTGDFDNLSESLTEGVLESVVGIVALIGCVVGLIILHPSLSLTTLVALPLTILTILWFAHALKMAMLKSRAILAHLNGYTQECLYGVSAVKTLAAEAHAQEKFQDLSQKFCTAQMRFTTLDAFLFSVLDGITSVTIGISLWFIVRGVDAGEALSAGVVVALIRYVQQIFDPLKQLGQTMATLQGVFTGIERIFGLLETESFVHGKAPPPSSLTPIRFENVSYCYPTSHAEEKEISVLRGLSFVMEPKSSLAIVGPTGGGKSTLVKLLAKLYSGYEGHISLNGCELDPMDPSLLRDKISMVPQDIVIFNASVGFDISLGNPKVTQEDIQWAAGMVGLQAFIEGLPGQYDFLLSEQGENLSVGQKQLIIFARALARKPELIILDEATSSIDPLSEKVIEAAISQMFSKTSLIVIAHRLSTVEKCTKILTLIGGHVVEEGTHQQLLKRQGPYYDFYQQLQRRFS